MRQRRQQARQARSQKPRLPTALGRVRDSRHVRLGKQLHQAARMSLPAHAQISKIFFFRVRVRPAVLTEAHRQRHEQGQADEYQQQFHTMLRSHKWPVRYRANSTQMD